MGKLLTKEEFIKKARKVHGDLYDYSKVVYINSKTKICIIDPEFGNEFWQLPNEHINKKHGNPLRAQKTRYSADDLKKEFIEKAIKVHNDLYDYSASEYIRSDIKIQIYDNELNMYFWQRPHDHLRGHGNPKRTSSISNISLTWLLSVDPKQKFITPYQEPTLVINGRKRKVDGYDPSTNTVYQFHGSYWHGYNGKEITDQKRYGDTVRLDQEIRDSGYNLVIMWEHAWKPTKEDWNCVPVKKSDTELFIEKARKVHGDLYDYSKTKYINARIKICIIDSEFGNEFWQSPTNHLSGKGNPIRGRQARKRQ